ncbi:MAG: protein kinase [Myxococcales bacterium]|nr:protein kinase [Polyangiaceae bacterium]MDW8249475.1 protein kinase [Myxococcales bacterium]
MASPDDPRAPPEGTLLDHKYRLVRFLAQGGMGAVYEAEGPGGVRLAIKVMLDTSQTARESGAWARFLREAQVSSSLSSPHIVQVVGGGIDAELGTAYLAMEFLSGEDLETLLNRVGPLHPQVAVRLVLQAGRGLQVAHRAGIVHRDLKPANLFLVNHAGEITVKVCDFGIAKIHPNHDQQHLTGTGHVLGSPLYMAPEQVLSSRRVDARADIWALAMTLYHALAGEPPLERHATFTELVLALTMQPIPPLQESAPWVTPGLAAVVHGALIRDTEARCPSIDEFLRALTPHAGGSDDVTAGMLVGFSEEQRRQVQPILLTPGTWQEALAHNREADPLLGKVLAGKYELVRTLGEGGMGAVYEARTSQGESFACKVIRPDLVGSNPDAMRRLMREARTSMRLVSPHVVRVIEVDNDMTLGLPFILMELLQGFDLSTLLASQGPLSPPAACRLFIDACRGLAVAHHEGVIHRDIKPANLFLHQTGGPGAPLVVKVCDFGIAKQTDSEAYGNMSTELTRTGGLLGSPLYMSPEQARNAKTVDARTDIWSLSLSLYEALTGQKAWQGFHSPGELVLAICTQEIRPIQDIAPWIPPGLAEVVHRGMQRDPSQRYASVEEMAQALEPYAASCPVLTLEALPLSQHQREVIAERSPLSHRAAVSDATADSTRDVLPRSIPSKPSFAIPAAVLAFAAAALLGGAWMTRSSESRESLAATPTLPVSAEKQPVPTTPTVIPVSDLVVRIPVSPPQAVVTVQGKPQGLQDGAIELNGKPGDRFQVTIEVDGLRREVQVILTSDGKAIPPSLEGPSRPTKAAAKSASTPLTSPNATQNTKTTPTKPDPPSNHPAGLGQQKDWR